MINEAAFDREQDHLDEMRANGDISEKEYRKQVADNEHDMMGAMQEDVEQYGHMMYGW